MSGEEGRTEVRTETPTTGRELLVAALVCALGAALVLLAAGRGWAAASVTLPAPLPARYAALTGGDLAPALNGLGLAGLAGLAGVIATRGAARVVVGGLIVLVGAGAVVSSVGATGAARVAAVLGDRMSLTGGAAVHAQTTSWWAVAVAGGVLLAAAGAFTAARGRRWPGMSSRYDAPGGGRQHAERPKPRAGSLWDAIDSGADPTADDSAPGDPAGEGPAAGGATLGDQAGGARVSAPGDRGR